MSLYQVQFRKENIKFRTPELKDLLWKAIDYSFLKILGESYRLSTYNFLRKELKKFQLPENINEFSLAIEKLFGFGSKLIEINIMEYLNSRIEKSNGITSLEGDFSLSEYIVVFKRLFSNY